MKKIAGGLNFTFSLTAFGILIVTAFEGVKWYATIGLLCLSIMPLAGIYYTLVTRFWTDKTLVENDLDKENIIIKKRIERQELLKKLAEIESKDK